MACRTVLRTVCVTEPWKPLQKNRTVYGRAFNFSYKKPSYGLRSRDCHVARFSLFCCSGNGSSAPVPEDEQDQGPPQEAVLKAISGLNFKFLAEIFKLVIVLLCY